MPIDLSRVQGICFDVDGTLSDTDDQFVLKLVKILTPFSHALFHKDVHKLARKIVMMTEGPGNWGYNLADRMGLDKPLIAISDLLYALRTGRSPQPFQLVQGIREMLVSLRSRYPLSIISARGEKSTLRFLNQFDLLSIFTAVATGQTCVHTKPYADPLIWAAERMGVPVRACLMVGDTVADILCGKNAGAQTIGVLCGFGERQELEDAGADHILERTSDLSNLFVG